MSNGTEVTHLPVTDRALLRPVRRHPIIGR